MSLRDGELKKTVLCLLRNEGQLLMIHKKRGQGAGKWNVPGGKLQPGESAAEAAARETQEETGLLPVGLRAAGRLEFYFPEGGSWSNSCSVYTADSFTGTLVLDSEECSASWISIAAIPLEKMWEADRRWLPYLLAGSPFHRAYFFNKHDQLLSELCLL